MDKKELEKMKARLRANPDGLCASISTDLLLYLIEGVEEKEETPSIELKLNGVTDKEQIIKMLAELSPNIILENKKFKEALHKEARTGGVL